MKRGVVTLALLSMTLVSQASAQGTGVAVDTIALQRLLSAAKAAHSDAVVIWKDGRQLGAWYFGKTPKRIEAMSATKSIVNLAIGRLVTTGAIGSVDDRLQVLSGMEAGQQAHNHNSAVDGSHQWHEAHEIETKGAPLIRCGLRLP